MTVNIGGYCPACGSDMLGVDEYDAARPIVCGAGHCPDPDMLARYLSKTDQHVHLIDFGEHGVSVQHPMGERLDARGVAGACPLNEEFMALTGPPGIGMYRVEPGASLADAYEVPRDEVLFEMPPAPDPEESVRTAVRNQWGMLPLGAVVGVPEDTAIPEDEDRVIWVLGQRIKRADYPLLEALWEQEGIDFGNDEETLLMPRLNDEQGVRQAVMRVKD